ncbi:hypothetical protein FS595_09070 [Serratia rubidaea]|uniref:ParE family toxin-like protein n=1 Tax=Serratia rubidaea TaxID=61652 RepID=UPI001F4137D1|nr:hypothetical protein [Serratia rubidaea]UJD79841.1 hypothetical protein FS596_09070 [Serratia rubidaea]UJD84397.1 hypothetical protein FS595_09070 [Serratia rubidaea]
MITLAGTAANPDIYRKAIAMLKQFRLGRRVFTRIKPHGYLKINISHRWRLLSKNDGKDWRLMTHETYNVESKKR